MNTVTLPQNLRFDAVLTPREDEITEVLAMAHSKKEVPDLIRPTRKGTRISVATVEHISKSIYRKTGAQKAAEITIWWFVRKYNIPVAMFFLVLFASQELISNQIMPRSSRLKNIEYKTGRLRRKSETDSTDYIYEA